jgi:hypothetical protein
MLNLYRLGFSNEKVATHLGVGVKQLERYIDRRANAQIKQMIQQEQIKAVAAVRSALLQKAIGSRYREGRPKVIEVLPDGKRIVRDEGEPAQLAIPGDLGAMKFYLMNCDNEKNWLAEKQNGSAGPGSGEVTEQMSERQIVDYIMEAVKDGLVPASLKGINDDRALKPENSIRAPYSSDQD